MNFHSRWNRKPDPRARRNKLRHSSSELAIEMAEPRLLLSGNVLLGLDANAQHAAAAAIVGAIHDNLANLGHVLGAVENAGNTFQQALPLLAKISGVPANLTNLKDSTGAQLFNLDQQFQTKVVNQIATLTDFSHDTTTQQVATDIQNALHALTGLNISVIDKSTSKDAGDQAHTQILDQAIFDFTLPLPGVSTGFTLDLNSLIGSVGLVAPAVHGNLAISESLTFETNYATGTTPTFAVSNIVSTTTFTATSDTISHGTKMNFGLLTVDVATDAALNYSGSIVATITPALSDATLLADATKATTTPTPDYSFVDSSFLHATDNVVTPFDFKIFLELTSDILQIPGFQQVAASSGLDLHGNLFAGTLGQVQVDFNGFNALTNLAEMSPADLLNTFLTVGGYINQLSQSSLLNIQFPFTNGATVGQVINFASQFGIDVLTELGSVATMIGLDHTHQAATATGGPASVALTPTNLSHLPENFEIVLQVDGHNLVFDLANTAGASIKSAQDLYNALHGELATVLQSAGADPNSLTIAFDSVHGIITFTAAPPTADPSSVASISIQTPGTSFTTLVTFAENLAAALGYGDISSYGASLQNLLAGIGLHFNSTASTLEFQLNYSTALPADLGALGFDGAHRVAADGSGNTDGSASGTVTVAGLGTISDFTSAFSFNLVINGHNHEVDIAADPSRTTATALASAITNALNVSVAGTDLGLPTADGATVLLGGAGGLIQVAVDSNGHITFSANATQDPNHTSNPWLKPDKPTTTPLLALADVHPESFSVGFDLGTLGSIKLSNAGFSFDATAGISMTIGLQIPSNSSGSAIAGTTPLDGIPIWPSGAITADQVNNSAVVARSDIGLGDDNAHGLSASSVEPLSDFIVASASGGSLIFTANAITVANSTLSLAPASGQAPTILIQDVGATALGFSAGQAAANDGTHLTLTNSGTITNFSQEFVFSLVINGHAVKVDVAADTARTDLNSLVSAINAALSPKTGVADMRVYLRDGTVSSIEFDAGSALNPQQQLIVTRINADGSTTAFTPIAGSGTGGVVTLADLERALVETGQDPAHALITDPSKVTVQLANDPTTNNTTIVIKDNSVSQYQSPEAIGFAPSQSAVAQKVDPTADPSTAQYQAILTANPSVAQHVNLSAPDYAEATQFLLTIGTLAPKLISVSAPATHDAASYAAQINAALAQASFTRAELGLSGSGTVTLDTIVHADASSGAITLTLKMFLADSSIAVNSNNSVLRAEAKFGMTINELDTLIAPVNGSNLAGALGIAGVDKNGLFASQSQPYQHTPNGEIDSFVLQGGALADRVFIANASLYAGIHLNIHGDFSAQLGFIGLSASADGNVYLNTTLVLQNPSGGPAITLRDISNAFTSGNVSSLWSFNIGSGVPGTPWAELTVSNIHITGDAAIAGLGSLLANNASIDIRFDGSLASLGDLLNTRPVVTYTGFSAPDIQTLSFSQIVAGIQKALTLLDNSAGTSVLTTDIPLIGVNLESVLHFADNFASFVTELQNQPAAAIDQVSHAIQQALGTTAVNLSIVTQTSGEQDLILSFNTTPLNVSTSLPLTLDLKALAKAAGIDLPDGVANLASASGTLAITAGATIGISLGIRLSPTVATASTNLADLNKQTGAAGDGTAAPDLRFVLANGLAFSVDIDQGVTTVQNLLDRINAAFHTAGGSQSATFATFSGGHFVFTDPSAITTTVSTNLDDLGFNTAGRVATASGNTLVIDGAAAPTNVGAEFAFKVVINGKSVVVDVPADSSRITAADPTAALAAALETALQNVWIDRAAFNLNGSGQIQLGGPSSVAHLVTVGTDHVTLNGQQVEVIKLTANVADIVSTSGPTSLAIQDLNPAGLLALGATSPASATDANGVSTISTTLPGNLDVTQSFRFDVVLNGDRVTINVPESGARTDDASLTAAINAALGGTLVDKSALGLSGAGKISVGQLVTASLNGSVLTFSAPDVKLGSSHTFALRDSAAPAQTATLEVIDLDNSGGAARLGIGSTPAAQGLDVFSAPVGGNGGYSIILTPVTNATAPATNIDYTKALAFDVVIDGHPITLSIGANAGRTDINALAQAINTALGKLSVDRATFGLNGSGTTTLDKILTATATATQITLAGSATDIPTMSGVTALTIQNAAFTASSNTEPNGDAAHPPTVTGKNLDVQSDKDRFFVDTSAPDPVNHTGTGILVTVGITATDLTFNTSFGPLSASIQNGTATLGAGSGGSAKNPDGSLNTSFAVNAPAQLVDIGLAGDADNHLTFSAIDAVLKPSSPTPVSSLFSVTTNVAISVDLPVFLVGVGIGDVVIKVSDILGTNGGTSTYMSLPTDFASHFNAFDFLNNPQAIINGLDALLAVTDTAFQSQVFPFKLPLIGNALASAGDFVGDLRSNVIGYLQGLVNDYAALHPGQEPTTAAIISDGLSQLLANLGFALPTSPDLANPNLSGITQMVQSHVDNATRTVIFDLNIEKVLFNGSVNMSADLGIPGLGISLQNAVVNLQLKLDLNLEFGYSASAGANQGFFFNDTLAGSHALALSISATLPPTASLTANLGIITMSATNATTTTFANGQTGTALLGGVFVDLHPRTSADVTDLGFGASASFGSFNETKAGSDHVVTADQVLAATNAEIKFNVSVNNFDVAVDVPADTSTTLRSAQDVVDAINARMASIDVQKSDIGLSGSGTVKLGSIVTAGLDTNGHLTFTSTDTKLGGADGHLAINGKLSVSDVPKSLRVDLQAQADLDLQLNAALTIPGASMQLPSVNAELIFGYKFAKLLTGFDDGSFGGSGVATPLEFKHVELDVGPFLTKFLGPILDVAWDIIGPIMPVLDFITSPLPGISDLIGSPTSLIDLAQLLGGDNPEVRSLIAAVRMLDEVANLIQTIHNMASGGGGDIKLEFGSFIFDSGTDTGGSGINSVHYLGTRLDPFTSSVKTANIPSTLSSDTASQTSSGNTANAQQALGTLGTLSNSSNGNGKLELPLLENPIGALKLLTGQIDGITLFTWELPQFTFGISGGKTFPVVGIPGIGIEAGLSVSFAVGLHLKFGYDTTGIVEFLHNNNPVLLLDGFYVDDTVGPQLTAHFGIAATAALDLFLVKAGVTGEIDGDFSFTLLDPNNDGRVRPLEILDTLLHDPIHIFVIDGAITANVSAWWWVGIDTFLFGTITLYEGSKTIVSGTLVSFHFAPEPTPIVATEDGTGNLNIDMGPLASQRAHAGDSVDGNENFQIQQTGAGAFTVTYHYPGHDYSQSFTGVTSINVDGGLGNNTIELDDVSLPMTINAGDGNNTIKLVNSTGNATINLGNGNNTVTDGDGTDSITVGDGNNTIFGGAGADVILAGAGANFISGGGGNDTITVGEGRNAIVGGAGNNTIKAGGGNDIIFGGSASASTISLLATIPAQPQSALTGTLSTLGDGSTDGDNTIRAGGGNDIIFGGGGSNFITAGSGNNVVVAALGNVQLYNGTLVEASTIDPGRTRVDQNNTVILGVGTATNTLLDPSTVRTAPPAPAGGGNQIILGGIGSNTLIGTNGANIIIGHLGSVDGPLDGSGNARTSFTIQTALPAEHTGDNVIVTGVGDDVILGGGGNNTIQSGPGNDIIAGHDALLMRSGAIGNGVAFTSFESLDETAGVTGNSTIVSGTGNDIVIGGGGNNFIDGGSGNNVLLGAFGKILPPDPTVLPTVDPALLTNGALDPTKRPDVIGRATGSPDNGNNTITATNGYNVIMGGGGANTITVGDGTNVIFGANGLVTRELDSNGNPIVVAATSADTLGRNDNITTGRGSNVVIGGAGSDTMTAGGGSNVLVGGFGTYTLPDGVHPDVVSTNTGAAHGNNTITVAGGSTVAIGGSGNDIITAKAPTALYDLGFDLSHRDGNAGDGFAVTGGVIALGTATQNASFLQTRYTFDVVVGGNEYTVDVGSDSGRTTFGDLAAAINAAFARTQLAGGGLLSSVLTASVASETANQTQMKIEATGGQAFTLKDAPSVNVLFGDNGSVVRTSALALQQASALDTLGFDVSRRDGNAADSFAVTAAIPAGSRDAAHIQARYVFDVVYNGTEYTVDVASDATRTGFAGLVTAMNNAFTKAGLPALRASFDSNSEQLTITANSHVAFTLKQTPVLNALFATSGPATLSLVSAQTVGEADGGNDQIALNYGQNVAFGGAGTDTITIHGIGANVVIGASGSVTAATANTPDTVIARNPAVGGTKTITVAADATGNNVIVAGVGQDTVSIYGTGNNIAIGGDGEVLRASGTLAFLSATTLDESFAGNSTMTIEASATGNNVLIGGSGADVLTVAGSGKNIVLGDVGTVTAATATDPGVVAAHNLTIGGNDTITVTNTASGDNILIGGAGNNLITIDGSGNNVAFGAGGIVERAAGTLALISADVVEETIAGNNTFVVDGTNGHLGNGSNILIGGAGSDTFTISGSGNNIVLGDIGRVTAATGTTPNIVEAYDTTIGSADTIHVTAAGSGNNILMGGAGADIITVDGDGNNIVFGDSGKVLRAGGTLAFISAETVDEAIGGGNTIAINGRGNNVVFGGVGSDTIRIAGAGNNIALGGLGIVTAVNGVTPDVVGRNTALNAPDNFTLTATATGNNIVMGESSGESIVSDATGFNVFFAATGEVTHNLSGGLVSVVSVDPGIGGNNTVTTRAGTNIIIGGAGADTLTAGDGLNYIIGNDGSFTFLNGIRSEMKSIDFADAGNDTIRFGNGETYVIGGGGNNTITGGNGNNFVVGDQGDITWDASGALLRVSSQLNTAATDGTNRITVGSGLNAVIGGGSKGNTITAGLGSDYIVGDDGFVTFAAGLVTTISSADPAVAGNNVIHGGAGAKNFLIGGSGSDKIFGGASNDYILGDNGTITLQAGIPILMTSIDFAFAGNDEIHTGNGQNFVIGGGGSDLIFGGTGRDQLIGGPGFISWNPDGSLREVSSLFNSTNSVGNNVIYGNGGNDNIIGGLGADTLIGGAGNSIIIGDDGHILFLNNQEVMAETLDQHFGGNDTIIAGPGNNFLFGGAGSNSFVANPLTDLIVIMDGHIDISASRQVAINIPPFFGDPMLSPLGKALNTHPNPGSDPTSGLSVLYTPANIDLGADAITAVFGTGGFANAPSLILSTLLGQPSSAFNLQGLLSDSIVGASLMNLLAIGPTSLIESVTVGDVLATQQSTGGSGAAVADNGHHAIHGVLAGMLDPAGESAGAAPALVYSSAIGQAAAEAPALPRPVLVEMAVPSDAGRAAAAVEPAVALIFDEERGVWVPDVAVTAGPRLILNGAELPRLDLSGEMTMAA